MTDLAVPATAPATRRAPATTAVVAGLLLGATTGVAARAVDAARLGRTRVHVVGHDLHRRRSSRSPGCCRGSRWRCAGAGWRWWAQLPVRVLAGFGALLLGGGAGIVMLPAIVDRAVAAGPHDWPRGARWPLGGSPP